MSEIRSAAAVIGSGSGGAAAAFAVLEAGKIVVLAGAEYATGFEARSEPQEPSTPTQAQSDNTVDKPESYDYWPTVEPDFWGGRLLSLTAPRPRTLETFPPTIEGYPFSALADRSAGDGDGDLSALRRIAAKAMFEFGAYESDIVLVNSPMIDYFRGSILDTDDGDLHPERVRQLSRSTVYWLQSGALRSDGGHGWSGLRLRLRGDITGTTDGLAQAPHIRESHRIRVVSTVVEGDLSVAVRGNSLSATFHRPGVRRHVPDRPASLDGRRQLPRRGLGAVPDPAVRADPATRREPLARRQAHRNNLHHQWRVPVPPVEEHRRSGGALASYALDNRTTPRAAHATPAQLTAFQHHLTARGVELPWPEVLATNNSQGAQ